MEMPDMRALRMPAVVFSVSPRGSPPDSAYTDSASATKHLRDHGLTALPRRPAKKLNLDTPLWTTLTKAHRRRTWEARAEREGRGEGDLQILVGIPY